MKKTEQHACPNCGAVLVPDPHGSPFRCSRCTWELVSLSAWQGMPPFEQGWTLYMQGSWPTSELRRVKNPHKAGTTAHAEFSSGEQRAMLSVQDGEE